MLKCQKLIFFFLNYTLCEPRRGTGPSRSFIEIFDPYQIITSPNGAWNFLVPCGERRCCKRNLLPSLLSLFSRYFLFSLTFAALDPSLRVKSPGERKSNFLGHFPAFFRLTKLYEFSRARSSRYSYGFWCSSLCSCGSLLFLQPEKALSPNRFVWQLCRFQ